MTRTALVALTFVSFSIPAFAQTGAQQPAPSPPPEYPIVRVGVLSYLQYASELENRDGLNSFDVTRAYLNVNAQMSDRVRFRFTPDVRRVTDGSLAGSLTVRVKYAFLQLDNVGPRSWIRFGLAQTPWLDFEESVNRYRVQARPISAPDISPRFQATTVSFTPGCTTAKGSLKPNRISTKVCKGV
jgi:hypothetical protein